MNLKKAIFYKSEKRTFILVSMLVFVMFSIYLSLSLSLSKYRIQNTLKTYNLPETIISYNPFWEDIIYEHEKVKVSSIELKEFIEEKGYSYKSVPFVSYYDLRLEAYSGDEYKIIEGKALNDLLDNEIAISKEYAITFDGNPLNQEVAFYNQSLIIKSIIEYPNYELAYQPLESLSDIPLFKEGIAASAITTENTVYEFQTVHLPQYWLDLDYEGSIEELADYSQNRLLKIKYDNFSFEKERELMNFINSYHTHSFGFYDNTLDFESLTILTKSNPLIELLKSSISKFVVSMILVSSTYAFYIHLKNELHSKRKTLATLNIVGVSFTEIIKTYFVFFIKIFSSSYLITIIITNILGYFKVNFKPNPIILFYLLGISLIFFIFIFGIFIVSLVRNRNKGYEEITSGGLSFIRLKEMKQDRLVRNLSMKRFTKTINLTLGFALSLALSIAVVLISMSSLNSIKNVYHQETLGLNFDYYIDNPSLELYRDLKEKGIDAASVFKEGNVTFLDYELNNPVDNITTGSTITVYDDIEPFITLDLGEFPPHVSTWVAESYEDLLWRTDLLVSKRLMDINGLYVSSDPNGPVDKHYLFTKENVNDYERALPIRGSFVTLMDRGFISYNYKMLNERAIEKGEEHLDAIIVKLNDKMDEETFEALLTKEKMDFIHIDKILKEFSYSNEKVNQDSFDILLVIIIAMTIQTIFNLSGVLVQVNLNRNKEDEFYQKIGLRERLLNKVHQSELILRFILTSILVLVLSLILLPLLNNSIKEAFAITYLPTTLVKEIVIATSISTVILSLLMLITSKFKGEDYVKN